MHPAHCFPTSLYTGCFALVHQVRVWIARSCWGMSRKSCASNVLSYIHGFHHPLSMSSESPNNFKHGWYIENSRCYKQQRVIIVLSHSGLWAAQAFRKNTLIQPLNFRQKHQPPTHTKIVRFVNVYWNNTTNCQNHACRTNRAFYKLINVLYKTLPLFLSLLVSSYA